MWARARLTRPLRANSLRSWFFWPIQTPFHSLLLNSPVPKEAGWTWPRSVCPRTQKKRGFGTSTPIGLSRYSQRNAVGASGPAPAATSGAVKADRAAIRAKAERRKVKRAVSLGRMDRVTGNLLRMRFSLIITAAAARLILGDENLKSLLISSTGFVPG